MVRPTPCRVVPGGGVCSETYTRGAAAEEESQSINQGRLDFQGMWWEPHPLRSGGVIVTQQTQMYTKVYPTCLHVRPGRLTMLECRFNKTTHYPKCLWRSSFGLFNARGYSSQGVTDTLRLLDVEKEDLESMGTRREGRRYGRREGGRRDGAHRGREVEDVTRSTHTKTLSEVLPTEFIYSSWPDPPPPQHHPHPPARPLPE